MAYLPVAQRDDIQSKRRYVPVANRPDRSVVSPTNSLAALHIDTRTKASTPTTTAFGTGDLLKAFAQGLGRSYVATGQAIVSGSLSKPFKQEQDTAFGKFTQAITGTKDPVSLRQEDIDLFGERVGRKTGGAVTLGLTALDLLGAGGTKGLKGLTRALKATKTESDALGFLKNAGFTDDIAEQYAPIFAKSTDTKQIETGLLAAEKLQKSTRRYTPVGERRAAEVNGRPQDAPVRKSSPRALPVATRRMIGQEPPRTLATTEDVRLRERIRAEARGARAGAAGVKETIRQRRLAFRALKDRFDLTDAEVAKIRRGRDISAMEDNEFQTFLFQAQGIADQLQQRRKARIQLEGTIAAKELRKWENLATAMKLPPISKMTTQRLNEFDDFLGQFKQGDEFLGVRQIETVENTDLAGIYTIREARERLATEAGVPVEELDSIKVSELDRYRYDAALARRNPFYAVMVHEKNKAILNAEAGFYEIKERLNTLINAARASRPRGVLDRFIPTDKRVFDWLEADALGKADLTADMTPEELTAAHFIQDLYADARNYLVQHQVLKRYISDYITHIRRGFLEAWRDDGLLAAFREAFEQYKQDEAIFDILNQQTGEILPLEKFFQFSMRRTGELEPTKNVASAVQAYFRAFEKKKALDSLVPKLDIYAHSLTPQRLTPKGLEFDASLKRFVKEWVNTKKGRVADTLLVKPGGKIDWTLRTGVALTRIIDLGLSVPIGIASNFGEQVATFRTLGSKQYALGVKRLATQQGRAITTRYKNFVGEPLMERLSDAANGLGDQLVTGMFSLFAAASRRANQIFLLANMTPDEFAKGAISPERLARLQTQMGRSRVVENFESVIGKTAPGKAATQYKTWAVPILSSTLDDITKVSRMLAKHDPAVLKTHEFKELMRTIVLTSAVGFGVYGLAEELKNKRDRSFLEDISFKAARDSLSLIGALDPSFWTATPRLLSFVNDLATSIKQLIFIEQKEDGSLRGAEKAARTLTPKAITQFQGADDEAPASPLPTLPSLPNLPKLPTL